MKNNRENQPEPDEKAARRKKIQSKNMYKDEKQEPTISRSLKKEFKKKKLEAEEEEWEDWDRYYNH